MEVELKEEFRFVREQFVKIDARFGEMREEIESFAASTAREFSSLRTYINDRFDRVDERLDRVERRIEDRFDHLDANKADKVEVEKLARFVSEL